MMKPKAPSAQSAREGEGSSGSAAGGGRREPPMIDKEYERIRSGDEGWISAWINKNLSYPLSKRLVRTSITPNQVTLASLLVSIVGAYLLAEDRYGMRCLGIFLIQSAVVLDGCDGQIARLKGLTSTFGAWFDTVVDDLANIFLLIGLAIGLWRSTSEAAYLFAGTLMLLETIGITFFIYHYLVTCAHSARSQDFRIAWLPPASSQASFWNRYLKPLMKRDFFIFAVFLFVVLDYREIPFWAGCITITVAFLLYFSSFLYLISFRRRSGGSLSLRPKTQSS